MPNCQRNRAGIPYRRESRVEETSVDGKGSTNSHHALSPILILEGCPELVENGEHILEKITPVKTIVVAVQDNGLQPAERGFNLGQFRLQSFRLGGGIVISEQPGEKGSRGGP